jgi:hypothetical protein
MNDRTLVDMPRLYRSDLTPGEQEHVRALLRVLRVQLGTWTSVRRALPLSHSTLAEVMSGRTEVTATIAFRVAKAFDAPISAVLTGQALPPGTCRHCGRSNEE